MDMSELLLITAATVLFASPCHWLLQPLLERTRIYRFHSAFVFSFESGKKRLALHLGTLYDLATKLRHKRRDNEAWSTLLRRDIGDALLGLLDWAAADSVDPDTEVTVGSHFLNPGKMQRLGFHAAPTPKLEIVNVVFLYWELIILQRLFTGRWRFVPLRGWQTYSITVGDLLKRRDSIEAMFRTSLVPRIR